MEEQKRKKQCRRHPGLVTAAVAMYLAADPAIVGELDRLAAARNRNEPLKQLGEEFGKFVEGRTDLPWIGHYNYALSAIFAKLKLENCRNHRNRRPGQVAPTIEVTTATGDSENALSRVLRAVRTAGGGTVRVDGITIELKGDR